MKEKEGEQIFWHLNMRMHRCILTIAALLAFSSLYSQNTEKPFHTVFLIGDAGEPEVGEMPHMPVLKSQLEAAGEQSSVIFLECHHEDQLMI